MPEKPIKSERRDDGGYDLETQFILRLPEEPAMVLRDAIKSGATIKERLSISLEGDLRKGMVRIDERYLYAKVVDLPCVVESLKTIDKKSFYKTSDICQMVSHQLILCHSYFLSFIFRLSAKKNRIS